MSRCCGADCCSGDPDGAEAAGRAEFEGPVDRGGVVGRFEDGDFVCEDDLLPDSGVVLEDEIGLMTISGAADFAADGYLKGGGPGRDAAGALPASCLLACRASE